MFLYHQVPPGVWKDSWDVFSSQSIPLVFQSCILMLVLFTCIILAHILLARSFRFFPPENIFLAIITCQYNKCLYRKWFYFHWKPIAEELVSLATRCLLCKEAEEKNLAEALRPMRGYFLWRTVLGILTMWSQPGNSSPPHFAMAVRNLHTTSFLYSMLLKETALTSEEIMAYSGTDVRNHG